jgi:aerobic-type carbon monoxide dehydrogenase small subunit (CoxS/CutS family)
MAAGEPAGQKFSASKFVSREYTSMAGGLRIKVNERLWPVASSPDTPLLYVLSNKLHLQGPRFGCGLGQCGSCSVLVDGVETRSCVTLVASLESKSVTTLEGLPAWRIESQGSYPRI